MTNVSITKMTDKLTTLPLLEMLNLDGCSLSHLPNFSEMSKLRRVFLPNNRLSKLDGLMTIYILSVYKNLFTEIPTLAEPNALSILNMNYNPVQHMRTIQSYTNLTDVRLS
jgi:Leucine-rich repeat (LRR) protein